MIMNCRG